MAIDHVEDHDMLILGAGLSGINAAHLLRLQLPHRDFAVLEARSRIGGTWSFFKYPGFRSDSSMSSFGLQWHTWPHESKVGSAAQITAYLESAVDSEPGLRERIRLDHRVVNMDWKTERARWRLEIQTVGGKTVLMDAKFIIGCTGYYDYERPLEASIPELEDFGGDVVHPQFWPEALDYSGKRVAMIGSGATAVTLLPELVKTATKVTQIQRSPSYVANIENHSLLESFFKLFLPPAWIHWFSWWHNVLFELFITEFVLAFPSVARFFVRRDMKAVLPKKVDVDVHFNPRYAPMTQRICLTPDGEYFNALGEENCDIVTDTIKTVTKDSVVMQSGRNIPADIIISATGLRVHLLGGIIPTVDGKAIHSGDHFAWRGCMLTGLPNMAFVFGYVTSTWTPGSDQMTKLICKLIKHMERKGAEVAVPKMSDEEERTEEKKKLSVDLTAGYILKASDRIPKATGKGVWYGRQNLAKDTWALWFGDMDEGMVYSSPHGDQTKKVR